MYFVCVFKRNQTLPLLTGFETIFSDPLLILPACIDQVANVMELFFLELPVHALF